MRHLPALAFLLALTTPTFAGDALHVAPFARDLGEARTLVALSDGTILVSRPNMFDVIAVRDRDGDGIADEVRTAVSSIEGAHGLAVHDGTLYVAGTRQIVAVERLPDGSFSAPRELVSDLPAGGGNPRRTLAVGKDGTLYVSVPEHGTLLQFDAGGANRRILARGLRDVRGLAWHPATGELWSADGEELNRIGDGLNFESEAPAATQAPGALAFDGEAAFGITENRIVRMAFADGKPGAIEHVATIDGARLAGFTSTPDAMYASDERGSIYRLTATPMTMTSSAAEGASMSILAKAFALPNLGGAGAVVHDEEQDVYFVSGSGFVARVSPEGSILEKNFIDGVKSPRGMVIHGVELWIADGTSVRVFDRVTGASVRTIELAKHGAVYLNHLAVGGDDAVYVTDTDLRIKGTRERVRAGDGRIFRVTREGGVEVAIHGEELRSPAGIAWDGMRFLIAQAYGSEIVSWQPGHHAKAVLRGPGAYEGLTILPNGTVIVTSRNDDGLHVGLSGELKPLFARAPTPGGIAFDRKRNRLLIPSSEGNWLEAWTLPPMGPAAPHTVTKERASDYAVNSVPPPAPSAAGSPDTSSTTR